MPNFVPGIGPKPCDIMLIGEAPGADEDAQGEPFVGRAGKRLSKALEFAGLNRSDVYITNCYKFRPPNNRKPTKDELNEHWPFLVNEILEVRPKFILLLGNTALNHFTGCYTISKCRGVNLLPELEEAVVYATFHPSATLYNPKLTEDFFSDVSDFVQRAYTTKV